MSKEELEDDYWTMRETDAINNSIENKKLKQQIADLEAKLAESEEFLIATKWKVEDLQKQLAEKEKEYQSFKKIADENVNYLKNRILEETRNHNQDKISFAVEQLEKVKELLLENLYDLYSKPSEIWDEYGDLYDVEVENAVNGTIDNQIKQLKEGK